jgi:hypothetical protein
MQKKLQKKGRRREPDTIHKQVPEILVMDLLPIDRHPTRSKYLMHPHFQAGQGKVSLFLRPRRKEATTTDETR